METWTDFVIARYNYWIVIILMMLGLYTVFARGNLVKKIVGLNIFQTSIFIFYITIGKVAGGTAPIYIGDELKHGHGYGDDHGDGYGEDHGEGGHGADAAQGDEAALLHAKVENDPGVNDLKSAVNQAESAGDPVEAGSLHAEPDAAMKVANDQLSGLGKAPAAPEFEIAGAAQAPDGTTLDGAYGAAEILYTNPLPHVLILTAIVVGVAGTAVGLALAVRIREAYGTIEEDELEAMDNVAEFGDAAEAASGAKA